MIEVIFIHISLIDGSFVSACILGKNFCFTLKSKKAVQKAWRLYCRLDEDDEYEFVSAKVPEEKIRIEMARRL